MRRADNGSKPLGGGGCGVGGNWLLSETPVGQSLHDRMAVALLDGCWANKEVPSSSNPRWACLGFWGEIESLLCTYLSSDAIKIAQRCWGMV